MLFRAWNDTICTSPEIRLLLTSSVIIYLVAFIGFLVPTEYLSRLVYSVAAPGVIIVALIVATVRINIFARVYEKQ